MHHHTNSVSTIGYVAKGGTKVAKESFSPFYCAKYNDQPT